MDYRPIRHRRGFRAAAAAALALLVFAPAMLWGASALNAQPGALRVFAGGPYSGQVGQSVFFSAQIELGGRPPGTVVQYEWSFGDGSMGFGQQTSHTYSQPGTYPVTVTATVGIGQVATDSTTAQISGGQLPGQLTVSAGGPYSGQVGQAIFFSAQVGLGGRPPGTPVQVTWTFGDGSGGTGANITHVYNQPGTYTVTVTASAGPGQSATDSTTAQVTGPPQLNVSAGGPYTGLVGQPVTVTGTASPLPQDVTVLFAWTFGDGASGSGQTTTHTYAAAGTYTVTLTVSVPATGQQGTGTTSVTVSGQMVEVVSLPAGCSNQALTWPVGTPLGTVVNAVSPPGVVLSIFKLDPIQQRFRGFSPTAPSFANDYTMVESRLEAVFFCLSAPGTLSRPLP